ncbi:3-oxo-5-alpha-steroid 4-dehydrogenase, C-terminal [Trema orientale]|uniref:3-oxo-5-alpha-steroid 4-dehydrogenase, C-terminal n=1 Tax=Trema orientale TaxID=63057 RepID=A0A2P5EX82_TREOI|nr:3-oxo-5-alpha-steroid 4-dehydrogenase, C-terminal [Trema orientale]
MSRSSRVSDGNGLGRSAVQTLTSSELWAGVDEQRTTGCNDTDEHGRTMMCGCKLQMGSQPVLVRSPRHVPHGTTDLPVSSVSHYKDYSGDERFWWRFFPGAAVFFAGMAVNVRSDRVLVQLKRAGGGYRVPRGWWFELVSCPNYSGEWSVWSGWVGP